MKTSTFLAVVAGAVLSYAAADDNGYATKGMAKPKGWGKPEEYSPSGGSSGGAVYPEPGCPQFPPWSPMGHYEWNPEFQIYVFIWASGEHVYVITPHEDPHPVPPQTTTPTPPPSSSCNGGHIESCCGNSINGNNNVQNSGQTGVVNVNLGGDCSDVIGVAKSTCNVETVCCPTTVFEGKLVRRSGSTCEPKISREKTSESDDTKKALINILDNVHGN